MTTPITAPTILVFEENYLYEIDGEVVESNYVTTRVSTNKIAAFAKENSYEYSYVSRLVEQALAGKNDLWASRKCSFGDQEDWYVTLAPDEGCSYPEKIIRVDINR